MTDLPDIAAVSAPLPWQAGDWSRLNEQLASGQLPHALLLTGTRHTGKSRLALALARLLLCAQPAAGLNCGKCHACQLSASGSHGDFQWLEPEGKSRVIKIDQVRKVVEFSNRTAGFGLRKVVVLSPAEDMTINAANALLKVLEEPPANSYFILVCHRLHGLPATVRSRCQILRLATPAPEQSLAWLDSSSGSRKDSERLLLLAGGRPLLAERLNGQEQADRLQLAQRAMAGLFSGKTGVSALAVALAEADLEDALVQLADGILSLLRGLSAERLATAQARAAFALVDEIGGIRRAISGGSNPNAQLMLESLLAKVQRVLGDGGLGGNIAVGQGGT